MTPAAFIERFTPCEEGATAARKHKTMAEAWDKCDRGDWLIWTLMQINPELPEHFWVKLACFCARQNWELLTDERSKTAVETAEAFIDRKSTGDECRAAAALAAPAKSDILASNADAAAAAAAYAAADTADAASYVAPYIASYAAYCVSAYAADAASHAAAADSCADSYSAAATKRAEQADWIKMNIANPFATKEECVYIAWLLQEQAHDEKGNPIPPAAKAT